MNIDTACSAMRIGKCLSLIYDGLPRIVEVHAVGISTAGNRVMRVYQVAGASQNGKPTGWKLMRIDEALNVQITDQDSNAPRPDYKRGDAQFSHIFCQL